MVISGERTASLPGSRIQCRQNIPNICRPDQTEQLLAIPHQDQCRPQLDAETAPEPAAGAVLELQVSDARAGLQGCLDRGLRRLAMAAPVGAEFDQGQARQGVDFGSFRGVDR